MREMDSGHIGVDESGKGDFFGPLVVAACFVGPEHLAELEGVMDSKKLTDAKALQLAAQIQKYCPHTVLVIMPTRYNELYAEIKNLNRLLEWGHAKVIEEVLKQRPCDLAISDQFANPAGLIRKLKLKGVNVELKSMVRAESDIAVAAASILARAGFLKKLKQLGEEYKMDLPKGATNVINPGKRFVQTHGADKLANVAKMHFKTAGQVLAQ
jgi:ribonuclease HIII